MEHEREPVEAEQAYMAAVKAARERRRWSQAKLAERLHEEGIPLGRGAVAKIESGVRALRWHEALALAIVLGTDPAFLGSGGDVPPAIQVTPQTALSPSKFRQWVRGQLYIKLDSDEHAPEKLAAQDEWLYIQRIHTRAVYRYAQDLVDAVEAGDDDARRDAVEALNAEAEQHRVFEQQHGAVSSAGRKYPESR